MGGTQRNGRRSRVGNRLDGIESLEARRLFAVVTAAVPDLSGSSQGVIYTFDAPVDNDAVKNSLAIWSTNGGVVVPHDQLAVTSIGTNQVRVTWPGYSPSSRPGVLNEGNFEAILEDGVGSPVTTRSVTPFFTMLADANHDRKTGFEDLVALSQNYNGTGKTNAQGDFDYDHSVGFIDLILIAKTYGEQLLPPSTGSTVTVAATTSSSVTLTITPPIDLGTGLPSTQFSQFLVYRSADGVNYSQVGFSDPALQQTGATSYSWTNSTGLSPGTTYSYLVQPYPSGSLDGLVRRGGWSTSNKASATTAASAVIAAPATGTSKAGVRGAASSRVALDLLDGATTGSASGTFASTRRIERESVIV